MTLSSTERLLVIIKKVKLRHFCSLALRFFNGVAVIELPFSAISFEKPQYFLLFHNSLEFCRAYFLCFKLGKHQNLLLLFRRLIFSTSALAFSHRTLIHSTQLLLFQQQISFPLTCSQK